MKRKKGFTLIELLVVIAIIGILVTITSVILGEARRRSKNASIVSTMANLHASIDAENYPNSLEILCSEFEPGGPMESSRKVVENLGGVWYCDSTVDSYRIYAKLNLKVVSTFNTNLGSNLASVKKVFAQPQSNEHNFGNYYCVNSDFKKNFTHWSGEHLVYPSCDDYDYTGTIQDPVENPQPTQDPNPETDPEPPIENGGSLCSGKKKEVCHFGKTLCIGNIQGHINHGDSEGSC